MEDARQAAVSGAAELDREMGKTLLRSRLAEERAEGLSRLNLASLARDAEATFILGKLALENAIRPKNRDREEYALTMLCRAAQLGSIQARALLNAACMKRQEDAAARSGFAPAAGPLVDFDGVPITVNRTGIFTPIDAVLEYADGENRLTLSANIQFLEYDALPDAGRFRKAVLEGFRAWEGDYRVFGSQPLRVTLRLTTEDRMLDNVIVIPVTAALSSSMTGIARAVGSESMQKRAELLLSDKRSFATTGLRWTPHSRKVIYVQSQTGRFDDYEEISHAAKHEFGHALGLGDLYEDGAFNLEGVEKGRFYELDAFRVTEKFYNLVMCDHHGPISDNDMEMVVLAFREGKAQLYQPANCKGVISKALGRGN